MEIDRGVDERGVALPFVAVILVLLLGMAAFAVDLGWIFLSGSRVQRAADSAALAAVVYLPGDTVNVTAFSIHGAQANGYDIGTVKEGAAAPMPTGTGGPDSLAWNALDDNKLEVTLNSAIPTFFLKVFGFDSLAVSRRATAEYVKPVPLGSPANCIGIGQAVTSSGVPADAFDLCDDFAQNFWAAMNGRATALEHGDPYGTECNYQCMSNPNPNWPVSGQNYYYHGIDVPPGTNWVDVYLYDAGFYDRFNFAETGDEDDLSFSSNGGEHMRYRLFTPDPTPLIPNDNSTPVSCLPFSGSPSLNINSETSSFTYENKWVRMCRIDTSGAPGIYILRTGNAGSSIGGNNSYSVLLDSDTLTSSNFPRVYAINSMSIFTNAPSGQATVYIAEVEPIHAGKILELTFYDAGESSGNADMTVLPPPGVSGHSCSWTATQLFGPNQPTSGSSCTIQTTIGGTAQFNGEWITMKIQLPPPATYNCTTDCFWKMDLDLNVSHDRTTWEARVIGNPVRLTTNQ